jgi:hypothetical protein
MNVKTLQSIRQLEVPTYSEWDYREPELNFRGESLGAQALPGLTELVRLGMGWVAVCTTAVAAVTVRPTTTAQFLIWNSEPQGGKCYVIDSVFAICTVSAAAAGFMSLACMLNVAPLTAQPTTADNGTICTLNGRKYGGKAKTSRSASVTDDKWWAVGNPSFCPGTGTVGQTVDAPMNGLVVVPPGFAFSVGCMATNTTLTAKCGIRWYELLLPNLTS